MGATVLAAGALAAGATWVATAGSDAKPLWQTVSGLSHSSESHPARTVDEAAQRADAIVVAHVTGVTEGRPDQGWIDPMPIPEKTVWVQITVDRVVQGSVKVGQVLNFELPPIPIEAVRDSAEPDQQLFFLYNRAAGAKRDGFAAKVKPADYNIWTPVGSRGVVAQGPNGLITPLNMEESRSTFLASFEATMVDGAANRAALAPR